VSIRHGIVYLEPRNIILKGHGVEDLDVNRDRAFLSGLRLRLEYVLAAFGVPTADHFASPDAHNELEAEGEGEGRGVRAPLPVPAPAPVVPDVQRTAQPHANVPATRLNVPPIPGLSNNTTQPPPPLTVNDEHRRPRPLAQLARRAPQPNSSVPSRGSSATSSHFATPGATMVAPMRLSPTRAGTEPLADEPPEPGSDWYFGHDDIDASFLSRAASVLDRTEALLSQSSQQSFLPPSQPRHEVIVVGDHDDKENTIAPRVVRHTIERQVELDGSIIDLSAEIIEGPHIQRPIDNDDVISIGSND
jgi:hypothetical protein